MPQLANITVKKADGTTDVVYTAVTGSAGDKSPAVWRNMAVGTTPAQYPEFGLISMSNGNGTSRRLTYSYQWPTVSTDAGGNMVVTGRANASGQILVPQNMTPADIAEVVHQFTGLMASTLVRSSCKDGYAPR